MKKIIKIEGMKCSHCASSVENALKSVESVKDVKVDVDKKIATVTVGSDIDNVLLTKAIADAGFEALSIETKKTLF